MPEPAPAPAPDEALLDTLRQSFAWCNPRAPLQKIPAKVSVSAVAHAARPVALERPAFLQKTGMTGAERGTAIHAFMQSVPFDGTAPDLDAEVQRQIDARLLDAGLADKLDLTACARFLKVLSGGASATPGPYCGRNRSSPPCPLRRSPPKQGSARLRCWCRALPTWCWSTTTTPKFWTTRPTAAAMLPFYIKEYAAQLQLYRRAFAQRLAVPVTKLTIYSFTLGEEIDIPLQATQKNL